MAFQPELTLIGSDYSKPEKYLAWFPGLSDGEISAHQPNTILERRGLRFVFN